MEVINMPRQSSKQRREIRFRKRLLTRKAKLRKIDIISRRGQPQVTAKVPQFKKQSFELGAVASSWIADIGYVAEQNIATMVLLDGKIYHFQIPFKLFEEWFHAHSKGTFFNQKIKDKYAYTRIR